MLSPPLLVHTLLPPLTPSDTRWLLLYHYANNLSQGRGESSVVSVVYCSCKARELGTQYPVSAGSQPPETLVPGRPHIPGLSGYLSSRAHTILTNKIDGFFFKMLIRNFQVCVCIIQNTSVHSLNKTQLLSFPFEPGEWLRCAYLVFLCHFLL